MFKDINLAELEGMLAYNGRDPYQERKKFEQTHTTAQVAARKFAFAVGLRTVNTNKLVRRSRNPEATKEVIDALVHSGSFKTMASNNIKWYVALYPEFVALGAAAAGKIPTSPLVKHVNVTMSEWEQYNLDHMRLVQKDNDEAFKQVKQAVWDGSDAFWQLLTDAEKEHLKKALIAQIDHYRSKAPKP